MLLTLADTDHAYAMSRGVLDHEEAAALAYSLREAVAVGSWTVSDVALIDDLTARLGPVQAEQAEEVGFYDIEELDDLSSYGVGPARGGWSDAEAAAAVLTPETGRERLLLGTVGRPQGYAHVLVDEAQDLSPMQWRMLGRRGRTASWTVVGDAAQASWGDEAEASRARDDALAGQPRQLFHLDTNYRNAREIFDYARDVILPSVPDADIPNAVRETGVDPVERSVDAPLVPAVEEALEALLDEVDGPVALITPRRWVDHVAELEGRADGRVRVIDPLSTKGLEWDATLVLDPAAIVEESPGGVRVLYVVLTRAAHRMTVLRPA